jgi:3-polyprenyl-4-hydroxybenzoate decarboxylase
LGQWLFNSRCGWFIPKVILFDDDIAATNLEEVVWAFATRTHPERDQVLFPAQEVLPLVTFLSADERQQARGMKAVYNGLARDEQAADEIAHRSSFRHLWPREIQERVERNWRQYGYGAL